MEQIGRTTQETLFVTLLFVSVVVSGVMGLLEAVSSNHIRLPTDPEETGKVSQDYFRPLIGIVSHPGDGARGKITKDPNVSYIAASYVKFVESAGARVVPFIYNESPEILEQKFQAVNGLLFTGGSDKYGPLQKAIAKLFQRALDENDKGEYFPVYAVCLSFEILTMVVSKNVNILERFDAVNHPSTLKFRSEAAQNSSIFKWFSPQLLPKLASEEICMQNHKFGISPERMLQNTALSSFFRILTTSFDKNNKEYVSTMEAYDYPVTAVQWHPEKNAFEWQIPTIPHSANSVLVTQSVANFVVRSLLHFVSVNLSFCFTFLVGMLYINVCVCCSEARKSNHRPTSQQEQDYLIYNYSPRYTGNLGTSYDQVYLFP